MPGQVMNLEHHQRPSPGGTERAFLSWGVRCDMDKDGPERHCDSAWEPRQKVSLYTIGVPEHTPLLWHRL